MILREMLKLVFDIEFVCIEVNSKRLYYNTPFQCLQSLLKYYPQYLATNVETISITWIDSTEPALCLKLGGIE